MGMAKQKMLDTAQKKVVKAVKTGAEGVKSVAGDALGAAASAAAGVVLERFSEALGSGQNNLKNAVPTGQYAVADNTRTRKMPAKKRKVLRRSKGGAKKRSVGTKKGAGKASIKKSSVVQRGARKSHAKKKSIPGRRGR
jgi:hypothetical protein